MVAGRRKREKRVDGAAAVGGLEERGCCCGWLGGKGLQEAVDRRGTWGCNWWLE